MAIKSGFASFHIQLEYFFVVRITKISSPATLLGFNCLPVSVLVQEWDGFELIDKDSPQTKNKTI